MLVGGGEMWVLLTHENRCQLRQQSKEWLTLGAGSTFGVRSLEEEPLEESSGENT